MFKRIVQVTHPIFRVGHYPRRVLACPGLFAPSSVLARDELSAWHNYRKAACVCDKSVRAGERV